MSNSNPLHANGAIVGAGLATETTLSAAEVHLGSIDTKVATETTLSAAEVHLGAIDTKVATETTLSAAEVHLGAIDASITNLSALTGTIRNKTTPTLANAAAGRIENSRTGGAYIDAAIAHHRVLTLGLESATLAADANADLGEGSASGISCDTSDVYVFAQLRESPQLVQDTSVAAGHWVLGAGWTDAGLGVMTHTAGGGFTADLSYTVQTTFPILVGMHYCVIYTVSACTAGQVTAKIGTAAGTARTANGTYIDCVTAAAAGTLIFTPDAAFDGSIDLDTVLVYPALHIPTAGVISPYAVTRVVGVATKAVPATLVASPGTAIVRAHWYRRAGHVEP